MIKMYPRLCKRKKKTDLGFYSPERSIHIYIWRHLYALSGAVTSFHSGSSTRDRIQMRSLPSCIAMATLDSTPFLSTAAASEPLVL